MSLIALYERLSAPAVAGYSSYGNMSMLADVHAVTTVRHPLSRVLIVCQPRYSSLKILSALIIKQNNIVISYTHRDVDQGNSNTKYHQHSNFVRKLCRLAALIMYLFLHFSHTITRF